MRKGKAGITTEVTEARAPRARRGLRSGGNHSHTQLQRVGHLAETAEKSSRGEFLEGGAKAADDALLAKHDHGIEERRCDGLADDGDANGVDEQTCFDATRFSDSATG